MTNNNRPETLLYNTRVLLKKISRDTEHVTKTISREHSFFQLFIGQENNV